MATEMEIDWETHVSNWPDRDDEVPLKEATYEVVDEESFSDPNRVTNRNPFDELLTDEF